MADPARQLCANSDIQGCAVEDPRNSVAKALPQSGIYPLSAIRSTPRGRMRILVT
jgi:hypothetical protein